MIELPLGWAKAELDELGEWSSGGTPSRSIAEYYGGDIPWVKTGDLKHALLEQVGEYITQAGLRNSAAKVFPRGSLLIAMYGATIGQTAILAIDAATNQACAALLSRGLTSELIPYVWKFLIAKQEELKAIGQGGAQPNINQGLIRSFAIPVAPLTEQKRIVAKIDSLTAKSRRAKVHLDHVPRLIEKYKQAVLVAAFAGDLTAEWRNERNLQKSWNVMALGSISDIQSGITLGKKRKSDEVTNLVPYLRVANVQRGYLKLAEIKYVEATDSECEKLRLKAGDILMNEGGDRDKLGRGWIWNDEIDGCIHQNHVFRVRLKDEDFPPKLISYFANEFGQQYFFDEGQQTTNLASISKTKVSSLPIPIPPVVEAHEIVRRIESAFARIDRLASETTSARKLIDNLDRSILTKAFRGELIPQDPNDEPASVLLERIRAERASATTAARGRREAV